MPRLPSPALDRRRFLQTSGLLVGGLALGRSLALADDRVTMPFANGGRDLVAYPQKRPLIVLTSRPPQLETPFSVFNEGTITPNDAFFVRYHHSNHPTSVDPAAFRLRVHGKVNTELTLSLDELKRLATPVDVVAVNQCSGNSRGFFNPRVNGGQLGHGAMGNARWTGIPLRALLEKAGVAAGARQVAFNGLDNPLLEATPDFVKALEVDHALDGEVMLAWAMNGADLPMLNGYPLRLVVPGYFGTYWVKHVNDIEVLDTVFNGFWMATGYRVPDNPSHSVEPGTAAKKTLPIARFTSAPSSPASPTGRRCPRTATRWCAASPSTVATASARSRSPATKGRLGGAPRSGPTSAATGSANGASPSSPDNAARTR